MKYSYQLYGLNLESDLPFSYVPEHSNSGRVADFSVEWHTGKLPTMQGILPIYTSPQKNAQGIPLATCYKIDNIHCIAYADIAVFFLHPTQIICHYQEDGHFKSAEILLLSRIMALIVEGKGWINLHASASLTQAGVIAFAGKSTAGKSTLATGLLQRGLPLLADDFLSIEPQPANQSYLAHPAYPSINLWPEQLAYFQIAGETHLSRVTPNSVKRRFEIIAQNREGFAAEAAPLQCVFLPQRRAFGNPDTGITIERLSGHQAAIELMGQTNFMRLLQALGLAAPRMIRIAALVQQIPVFKVTYPSQFHVLNTVLDQILEVSRQFS